MKLSHSKRFWITIGALVVNFTIGIIGVYNDSDILALGEYLALANTPLFMYILGDSYRPSN
jgi:hypothetical protein|tara:strand:+ start:214 stop:396 length:183 start_codon:yes stop_codon:yes gene_type:complete